MKDPDTELSFFISIILKTSLLSNGARLRIRLSGLFDLIEELQRVPETYLKHIENTEGLFEIRVQLGNDIFRIFCFFDQGQLIILANGFQKKTQKTPKKELEKALKIKEEYENEKKQPGNA